MRETKRQQEERERIEKLKYRVNMLKTIAERGGFILLIVFAVFIQLVDDKIFKLYPFLWLPVLPFTCLSGTAVYFNFKLPRNERIRTTCWWSRSYSDKGPLYTFVVFVFTNTLLALFFVREFLHK